MHCDVLNIDTMFNDFYRIPEYQRDFVWESENVVQLLEDIDNSRRRNSNEGQNNNEVYFIGCAVVIGEIESGTPFDLIDGQQRLTSLYMTFCAIHNLTNDEKLRENANKKITSEVISPDGKDKRHDRIEMSNERNSEVLEEIAKNNLPSRRKNTYSTDSERNIFNAYRVIEEYFKDFDDQDMRKFYGYLVNKVMMVRIKTENLDNALVIFETINERGIGLNSFDLLKNLLYLNLKEDDQYEKLTLKWRELRERIEDKKEKPMRFLRYFVLSQFDIDHRIQEDQVYKWIKNKNNEHETKFESKPLELANQIRTSAEHYINLLHNDKDYSGEKNCDLQNLRILGGKSTRQHMMVLLAAGKLNLEQFSRLVRNLESVLFFYFMTKTRTQVLETKLFSWTKQLRKMGNSNEEFEELIKLISNDSAFMQQPFFNNFNNLSEDNFPQKYRFRYFLAKFNQYVNVSAGHEAPKSKDLSQYIENHDIEHIASEQPNADALLEFGEHQAYGEQIAKVGNLILIESTINKSAGNLPFSEKKKKYKQSSIFFARTLGDFPKEGLTKKSKNTLNDLVEFKHWNPETIQQRQDLLKKLALKIWGMPVA